MVEKLLSGEGIGKVHAQIVDRLVRQRCRDDEIRWMLGQWQSELEPVIAYGPNWELLGLTIAGIPHGERSPIVVAARR